MNARIDDAVTIMDGKYEGEEGAVLDVLKGGWLLVELSSGEAVKVRQSHVINDGNDDEPGDEAEDEAEQQQDEEAAADEGDDEGDDSSPLARQMAKYRARYEATVNATGNQTKICGDSLSHVLLQLEPIEVMRLADALLDQPIGTHANKYGLLNPGQQRMNAGNRIRALVRKGDVVVDSDEFRALVKAAILPRAAAEQAA